MFPCSGRAADLSRQLLRWADLLIEPELIGRRAIIASALPLHILRLLIHEADKAATPQMAVSCPLRIFKVADNERFQPLC